MKKYTILKNWHYAFFLFGRLFGWYHGKDRFEIKFKFSSECWWNPPRNQDDYDLNKLFGLSFGLFSIHKDSVRFTWCPDFDNVGKIKIYGYVYDSNKKDHDSLYLCTVDVDKEYTGYLYLSGDKYIFQIGTDTITMDNKTPDKKTQKEIYPYFGGNNKAIIKMYIWVSFTNC